MGDLSVFSLHDIATFIRDREWNGCKDFTVDDIKNSNVIKIRQVYLNFLNDFGFSKDILHVPFDILEDIGEHQELYRDILPLLGLQAALEWLLQQLMPEDRWQLNLHDLINPGPKRTQRFLTVLQNFWLFCSQIDEELSKRLSEVQDMVKTKEKLIIAVERFKTEYNNLVAQNQEDQATEELLEKELEKVMAEIDHLSTQVPHYKNKITAFKEEIEQQEHCEQEIFEQQRQVDREMQLLQGSVEKGEAITKLEMELEELERNIMAREVRSFQLSNNVEKCEQLSQEYAAQLEQSRAAQEDGVRMRQLRQKNRELAQELERLRLQDEEMETIIRDLGEQAHEAESSLSVAKLKASRRKAAKEEEARELQDTIEERRRLLGKEEQEVAAVAAQVAQLEARLQDLHRGIRTDEDQCKLEYSSILERIEAFNTRLSVDYDRMDAIKSALDAAKRRDV